MWPVDNSPPPGSPQGPAPPRLAFLDRTLSGVAANLALDEALLIAAEDGRGGPALRIWELPEFAVVLGASGRWRSEVRVDACEADGVPIARRSSGGGTVVIGPGALNFAVILPIDSHPALAAVDLAQLHLLGKVADALKAAGLPVEVRGSGDLTLGPRKFSGSAQRRMRRHLLVHATILYDFPLERIGRYLATPARQPSYREGRSHLDFVANLPLPRPDLVRAIRDAWLPGVGEVAEAIVPDDLVAALVAEKLADRAWVERL